MPQLSTVAFDADDTLWHNERFYRLTQERFAALLSDHTPPDHLAERLLAAERRNLGRYGFGIKGFILSMIETAIDVTNEKVPASVIREIIAVGQEMLAHPVELLPHAREAIAPLVGRYRILLVTKGDLLDQERKLAQSGLGEMFDAVEIVSDKTAKVYADIFSRHPGGPEGAAMVGNSLKSDVIPAIAAGAWGIYVPHDLTWIVEHDEPPADHPRFRAISDLGELGPMLDSLIEARRTI